MVSSGQRGLHCVRQCAEAIFNVVVLLIAVEPLWRPAGD